MPQSESMVEYFSDFVDGGEILSVLEDGIGEFVSLIEIVSDDFTAFPELEGIGYVLYREDDQGFKSVELVETIDELEKIRKQYLQEEEE